MPRGVVVCLGVWNEIVVRQRAVDGSTVSGEVDTARALARELEDQALPQAVVRVGLLHNDVG